MLTRPTWHEAEAEARESEAEAKEIFRGRGQNVWGRGRGPVLQKYKSLYSNKLSQVIYNLSQCPN